MKPLSLRARNLRTWAELELDLEPGITAIVGPNGAGKSTLVSVLDLALFGSGRELKRQVTRGGAEDVAVEVVFEHGGSVYRVARGYSTKGRGKPTLALDRLLSESVGLEVRTWEALTRETIDATEAELERILGLSRQTFRASSYLAQDDGAAFTMAEPRERKAILLDALGVRVWDELKAAATGYRLAAEVDLGKLETRRELLEAELARRPELEEKLTDEVARSAPIRAKADELETKITGLRTELDEALEAGAEKTRLLEQARRAASDVATASSKAEALAKLEDALETAVKAAGEETDRLVEAVAVEEAAKALIASGRAECQTCGQPIVGAASAKALEAVRARLSELEERQGENLRRASEAATRYEEAGRDVEKANADTLLLIAAEGEARQAYEEATGPDPDAVADLRNRITDAERDLRLARQDLAGAMENVGRAKADLERLDTLAAELEEQAKTLSEVRSRVALLRLAERAYGRDGIPALILEAAAIPQLENHANRIVEELGRDYRFELRTLRETAAGGVKEALDVVVWTETGEALYEDFSGGERTRLDLALRIALARLLAARRGADVRLLAIDEPSFLDEEGFMRLATVLRSLEREFETILVVSHVDALRDSFDHAIIVGGGADSGDPSRVEEVGAV